MVIKCFLCNEEIQVDSDIQVYAPLDQEFAHIDCYMGKFSQYTKYARTKWALLVEERNKILESLFWFLKKKRLYEIDKELDDIEMGKCNKELHYDENLCF